MSNTKELKEALKKDFHVLYVKGFTNTWEVERLVRDVEIDVMQLESTERFIEEEKEKSYKEGKEETFTKEELMFIKCVLEDNETVRYFSNGGGGYLGEHIEPILKKISKLNKQKSEDT